MDFTLAWTVILSGISIVFLVLVILTLIVMAFGKIMDSAVNAKKNNKSDDPVKAASPAPKAAPAQIVEDGISDEVVAVISASIAAVLGGSGFAIHSVRRAKETARGRSVWSLAGMQQNTSPF